MPAAATPDTEQVRINTLRALRILDTPPDERFDRLTRLALRLFDVPIALVSFVDAERQWYKSISGIAFRETPRSSSICAHAILGNDILVVPDTLRDDRFKDNPFVTGKPHVRFYAGYPLSASNGSKLGTLSVLDDRPRDFGEEDRSLLRDLGRMAEQELLAVELATHDPLTDLANRLGFVALAENMLTTCKRLRKPASLFFFDLDNFKQINDTFGHAVGDQALSQFADVLRGSLREGDIIGRLGGDEFVMLLAGANREQSDKIARRIEHRIAVENQGAMCRGYRLQYSVGHIEFDDRRHVSVTDLLAAADAAMYAHKRASQRAAPAAAAWPAQSMTA
ncbi:sensor domain-containing diguanylate cyclase [Cupriavidus sp. WS]|uniref:sensor domain-containing diguanylate cyclase n=1 Tax=Cupriavidus sp. WS TaxID=1312922 RepID=UPI00036CB8F0|nr:sensor domain-containing diguanylate cyclase [Cupriavidus sp. WS]